MLTSGQCRVAAYLTDGGVVCLECGEKELSINRENEAEARFLAFTESHGRPPRWSEERAIEEVIEEEIKIEMAEKGIRPLIQYELDSDESWSEDGLSCDGCGTELVEPMPDMDAEDEDEDTKWRDKVDEMLTPDEEKK
jgi:hypothetical protein